MKMTTTATITATATVSAKVLANRAAARERDMNSRAAKIMAKAVSTKFCANEDTDAFMADSAGRTIRLTPASNDEIRHFLLNNRVVDTIDILAELGEQAFNNLVANGSLRRDANFSRFKKNNLYWVSAKAQALYNLPARIKLVGGAEADYVA
jgi:hypothetical protein